MTVTITERKPRPYHMSAEGIRSTWVKPKQVIKVSMDITLTTTVLCCGILSSQYFDEKSEHEYSLPIRIVRFCEIDRKLYDLLMARAPEADPHRDLRVMVENFRNKVWDPGKFYTDFVEITAVCYDNTILNQLNGTSDHPDADLFLLSVEYVECIRPKYVVSEMTPMHEHSHVPHLEVVNRMRKAYFIPMVTDRAPACFVDGTNRDRWLCFGQSDELPLRQWTTNLLDVLNLSPGISSAKRYLLPADEVPPELWERRRVERRHPVLRVSGL